MCKTKEFCRHDDHLTVLSIDRCQGKKGAKFLASDIDFKILFNGLVASRIADKKQKQKNAAQHSFALWSVLWTITTISKSIYSELACQK